MAPKTTYRLSKILSNVVHSNPVPLSNPLKPFSPSMHPADVDHIVVIGLGPTGLAHALAASKFDRFKRPIIALTDRNTFLRSQIFLLDDQVVEYLRVLTGDEAVDELIDNKLLYKKPARHGFFNGDSRWMVQIRVMEELLYHALSERNNVQIIYVPKDKYTVSIEPHKHVVSIGNMDDPYHQAEFKFKYLVTTDGAPHRTVNSIPDIDLNYHPTTHQPVHVKHATITYVINDDSKNNLLENGFSEIVKEAEKPIITELWNSGWTLFSKPEARIFHVGNALYLGTEYPEDRLTDRESIHEWMQLMLRYYIPQRTIQRLGLKVEENTACTNFRITLYEGDQNIIPLPQEGRNGHDAYVIVAGDARKEAHYQSASGAVTGTYQARLFHELMQSEQTEADLVHFDNRSTEFLERYNAHIGTLVTYRNNREIAEAKKHEAVKTYLSRRRKVHSDNFSTLFKKSRYKSPEREEEQRSSVGFSRSSCVIS